MLTLPMLRLLSFKAQWRNYFWKPYKPCHIGLHWIALADECLVSTHVPGFHLLLMVWTLQGAHLMVCNRSWHLPRNPKLVWHPARLIKTGGCMDLSMDTLHLKYLLVLFGSEGPALTLPLFLLSPIMIMLCHCSSTMTTDNFLLIFYGTK